jgi:hypothetical protein
MRFFQARKPSPHAFDPKPTSDSPIFAGQPDIRQLAIAQSRPTSALCRCGKPKDDPIHVPPEPGTDTSWG